MPTIPQEQKQRGDLLSAATSLAAGGAIALGLSLLTLAVASVLISNGTLGEDWTSRAGVLGSFLGCMIGGCYAIAGIRSRALAVGLGVSVLFGAFWVLAGLLWLNGMGGLSVSVAAAALLGGGLSGILFATRKKRRK